MASYTSMIVVFPSLRGANIIGWGGSGLVYVISEDIVFKCPSTSEYQGSQLVLATSKEVRTCDEQNAENVEVLNRERRMYDTFKPHMHRNIAFHILSVPEGFFIQRYDKTLDERLQASPASTELQEKWIAQLVSVAVYLENLGYVHGDLRPQNILLDRSENIKVIDFDCSVKVGDELRAATIPYAKLNAQREPRIAGPESEQFSLGACIYNIRYGVPPYSGIESPVWYERHIRHDFPSTSDDVFGDIIQKCWHGHYASISALEIDVLALVGPRLSPPTQPDVGFLQSSLWYSQCQELVARERLRKDNVMRNRLHHWYRWIIYKVLGFCFTIVPCQPEESKQKAA